MSALRSLRLLSTASRPPTRTAILSMFNAAGRGLPIFSAVRHPESFVRGFSATTAWKNSGVSDHALAASLEEEIKFEETSVEGAPKVPEFLQQFNEKGIWKILETDGRDDVVLTRSYGNEKIRLEFSVVDIVNSQDSEFEELHDEESKPAENTEEQAPYPTSYPLRVNIVISKSGSPSAMAIEASVQDGAFVVDAASYYADASLASDVSVEGDWKRRNLYLGPQYDRLELTLQERFDEYLKERGIGEDLAMFIPDYAEWKEQKEYVSWLKNVHAFVEK